MCLRCLPTVPIPSVRTETLIRCVRRRPTATVLIVALALGLVACGPDTTDDSTPSAPAFSHSPVADSTTIPRMLTTDDRFSTLRAALDSTGLDSLLATEGPFTLFAPPNGAFAAVPTGPVEDLLTEDRDRLRTLLARHVVERRVAVDRRSGPRSVIPMSGDTLSLRPAPDDVQIDGTPILIDGTTILDANIEAGNGRIHVVDAVLRAPRTRSPVTRCRDEAPHPGP